MTTYIVDACALIAFLRKEKGSERFVNLIKSDTNQFFMHAVNLGEVYYDTVRFADIRVADELLQDIGDLPIHIVWSIDIPFIRLVGTYKTSFQISYADAFVLSLAERERGVALTTDHHEFDPVEDEGIIQFYWLR